MDLVVASFNFNRMTGPQQSLIYSFERQLILDSLTLLSVREITGARGRQGIIVIQKNNRCTRGVIYQQTIERRPNIRKRSLLEVNDY